MSALQQIRHLLSQLRRAFDQQIAQLPVLGSLFSSSWNIIVCDRNDGYLLVTRQGTKQIPQQIAPDHIKGRNCLRLGAGIGQLRSIRLPNAALNDPTSAVRLSLDTLSPLAPEETAFAVQSTTPIEGTDMFEAQIALTSKSKMEELLRNGQSLGLKFAAIDVGNPQVLDTDPVIDLVSGQAATARISPSGVLTLTCAALLIMALAFNFWAVWKLGPEQKRLSEQVSPAEFNLANLQKTERLQRFTITEIWSAVSKALPDSAWAESLVIDKQQLRLAGHASNAAELVGFLEASPVLSDVALAAASVQESDGSESFDLQASILAPAGAP